MAFYNSLSQKAFFNAGPFFHLYTKPLETEVYFHDDKERIIARNYIAMAARARERGCRLLAYSIMNNHFHFIIEGSQESVLAFFKRFSALMNTYFRYHGRGNLMAGVEAGLTEITTLSQLRNEIAYVIRNSFAARQDVNVFADPWSTGFLYFNPMLSLEGIPASQLKGRALREFTCSRNISEVDGSIYVKDGQAQPWSFVDYKRAMSFYDNARQFVASVMKNVEAMVELSLKYGEIPIFNDDELYPVIFKLIRQEFRVEKLSDLDVQGKKKLAVLIKNRYAASNGQIARLVGLPLKEVNPLFPMVAKDQIK